MQALVSLPPPPGIIWHYPGVPSLLVTYGVANDFFFSGHTAIAVFGATELARFRKTWLTVLAVSVVIFEIAAVLVLRAHYTMDVFTGALAAVCVAQLCSRIDEDPEDRYLAEARLKESGKTYTSDEVRRQLGDED
jgi:membrane-associated phospholipid phosphatase